jgi:hypothetical protein
MASRRGRRPGSEAGFSSVETLLLVSVVVLFVEFVFFCGRAAVARQEVYGAARDAARAASISSIDQAQVAAVQTADLTLSTHQAACADPQIKTDLSNFRRGGAVTVVIACHMTVADLDLLHAPGHTTVQTSFTAPIDLLAGGL